MRGGYGLACLDEHVLYPLRKPAVAQLHVDEARPSERRPLCNHGRGREGVYDRVCHVCGLLWRALLRSNGSVQGLR